MEYHHRQLVSPPPPIQNPNLRQNQNYQPPPTPVMPKPIGSSYQPDESNRRCHCTSIIPFVVILAFCLILFLWLVVYRAIDPEFGVVSAAMYGFNATAPPLMTTSMQFNVVITNPSPRVGIYFDNLNAHVLYRNQPITALAELPALYMEEQSSVSVSPMIGGSPVLVSRDVSNGLAMDEAYGAVGASVIMEGRLRWKAGAIRTWHDGIFVTCDVLIKSFEKGVSGQVPLTGAQACYVEVYEYYI